MSTSKKKPRWRRLRRFAWIAGTPVALLTLAVPGGGWWVHQQMADNLPQLAGRITVPGLDAAVTVERDALGVPALRGTSRRDVALATGFVHGQDRFFQMDMLRRRAAGELAELVGEILLEEDRGIRPHRFRAQAERLVANSPAATRELLEAYTAGVNAALTARGAPFEYAVLRAEPRPWRAEDTFLVLFAMFSRLQDLDGGQEGRMHLMHELLPAPLFELLHPPGTEWDAPLIGQPFALPPLPDAASLDLRTSAVQTADLRTTDPTAPLPPLKPDLAATPGASSAWAVAGPWTADGRALLANELHLDLAIPNYWYRAAFSWPAADGTEHRVVGATLPGVPAIVVGTNGHVAWGVTNSVIDTSDIVLLEDDPQDPALYWTPDGPRRLERHREILRLRGGDEIILEVEESIWGPVIGEDHAGRRMVLRAVADLDAAVDFEILGLETARTVEEALAVAHRSGVPALNFTVADRDGRIAWSIIGRVPRRFGHTGRLPTSWADGSRGWDGLLAAEEIPRLVDPEIGRLWMGNNRLVDGEMLARLGDGGYMLGARPMQVRDALLATERTTVEDMRRIQLDDRALFYERWHDLLLEILTPEAVAQDPRRRVFRELVEDWGGHAAVASAGFRMVRSYRILLAQDIFRRLTAPCREKDPDFLYFENFDISEGPLWQLVSQQPEHLVPPGYDTWDEALLAGIDATVNLFSSPDSDGESLRQRTWGERNTADIGHLFSRALPVVDRWLDMPAEPLAGADYMPRIQHQSYGASLRMVIAVGSEENSFFQMPGGQSGNPLAPHYGDSHAAWTAGEAAPLAPGAPLHTLEILP